MGVSKKHKKLRIKKLKMNNIETKLDSKYVSFLPQSIFDQAFLQAIINGNLHMLEFLVFTIGSTTSQNNETSTISQYNEASYIIMAEPVEMAIAVENSINNNIPIAEVYTN